MPANRRPQAYALDRTPINIGICLSMVERYFLPTSNSELDCVSRECRDVGRKNSLDICPALLLLKALVNGEISIISQPAEFSSAVSFLAAKHCVVTQDK
jgi:hypothetical protein